MTQPPPNEPREPYPILPVTHTASAFDDHVYVRPAPIPGWAEVVRVTDGVTRAALRLPKP